MGPSNEPCGISLCAVNIENNSLSSAYQKGEIHLRVAPCTLCRLSLYNNLK